MLRIMFETVKTTDKYHVLQCQPAFLAFGRQRHRINTSSRPELCVEQVPLQSGVKSETIFKNQTKQKPQTIIIAKPQNNIKIEAKIEEKVNSKSYKCIPSIINSTPLPISQDVCISCLTVHQLLCELLSERCLQLLNFLVLYFIFVSSFFMKLFLLI